MEYSTSKFLLNSLQLLLTVAVVLSFSACGSSQKESDESGPSTYDSVYDGYKKSDGKKKPERQYPEVENKTKEPVVENTKDPVTPTPEVKKPIKDPVVKKPKAKPVRVEPVTLDDIMARYIEESEAAFDASKDYTNTEGKARDEAYIVWAEHMYAALGYANLYAAKGGSLEDLPELRELKILKAGNFKNALGPSDDPRVKAAIKKWQESTK